MRDYQQRASSRLTQIDIILEFLIDRRRNRVDSSNDDRMEIVEEFDERLFPQATDGLDIRIITLSRQGRS